MLSYFDSTVLSWSCENIRRKSKFPSVEEMTMQSAITRNYASALLREKPAPAVRADRPLDLLAGMRRLKEAAKGAVIGAIRLVLISDSRFRNLRQRGANAEADKRHGRRDGERRLQKTAPRISRLSLT